MIGIINEGADARLADTRIHVWAIVGRWKSGQNIEEVAADYEITTVQVQDALAYYQEYQVAIDARLAENARD